MYFFFFQAEDGIRDKLVTGVQTCALPIFPQACRRFPLGAFWEIQILMAAKQPMLSCAQNQPKGNNFFSGVVNCQRRSEERRVGKECRSRWWMYHEKKKLQ